MYLRANRQTIKIHWQSLTLNFKWRFVKNVTSRSFSLTRMTFKFGEVCCYCRENFLKNKMKLFTLLMAVLGNCSLYTKTNERITIGIKWISFDNFEPLYVGPVLATYIDLGVNNIFLSFSRWFFSISKTVFKTKIEKFKESQFGYWSKIWIWIETSWIISWIKASITEIFGRSTSSHVFKLFQPRIR